jgi:hypothetical protein
MIMTKKTLPMSWKKRYDIVRVMTSELGNTDRNGTAIGRYYSGNRQWCAEFVSYCYYRAGVPLDNGSFTSSIADGLEGDWMHRSTIRLRDWFLGEGKYIERRSDNWFEYMPLPGDFAYIGRAGDTDRKHAAIVEYLDKAGTLHTIEGNNAGRPVGRYSYPLYKINDTDNGKANGIVLGIGVRDEIKLL